MQITLNSSEDFRQLFNIVKLVNEEFGNYSHSLHEQIKVLQDQEKKYQTYVDELKQKVLDKNATINGHICENNKLYAKLDDLQKEIKCLSTLNSELSKEIERIKTQQSCDEAYVVSGIAIDDLRAELKATIEENDRHKQSIQYSLEIQSKLCEIIKRQYPLFDFERWLADYEKEKVRIKKEQKRAKKHEINWNKIQEEAKNERTDNQST